MKTIEECMQVATEQMDKTISHTAQQLSKIRAGKASPVLLDGLQVIYYGSMTPLSQVASITTPDAKSILIKPWEKNIIPEIEKAILAANLGVTPQNDGQQIVIHIPVLTEERRTELMKQVTQICEKGKVSIRNDRKDANEQIHQVKGISEDESKQAQAEIQKLTKTYADQINELMKKKEEQIMTI